MKTVLYIGVILAVLITGYNTRGIFTPGTVKADVIVSDKYDGGCPTPPAYAIAGRCADKCPNQTDYLMGYDKETGAAVCRPQFQSCPYADAEPIDSPVCQKLTADANVNQNAQSVDVTPPNVNNFVGK